MDKEIRILIVEDNAADAELIARELGKGDFVLTTKWVKSREEYLKALQEFVPDIILCDYRMPELGASEALKIVKERLLKTPFIVVSGTVGDEIALEMMKLGAADYVMKDKLAMLIPVIEREVVGIFKEKEVRKHSWDCVIAETRTTPVFMAVSEALSILIFFAGCGVLVGWALDIPALKSILPGLVTMKANTALCFVFLGLSLWLLQIKRRDNPLCQGAARVSSSVVLGIGLLTLSEYLFGWNLGIDQLLFKELPGAIHTSSPGRMAFNTAINFTITGLALFLLASKPKNRCFLTQILIIPTGIIAILSIVGYLYHADPLFIGLHFSTAMALHTAVLFFVVFVGVLFAGRVAGS